MNEQQIFAKCAWRLLPLIAIAYVANYLDRTNVGIAALTMNKDLGFSPSVYGFGAGMFFVSYSLFQVPANLVLHKVGARRWMFCILVGWGAAAAASSLIQGPYSFYALRFLLGVAEAGFFPGVIVYLTLWFPKTHLTRMTAFFMAASQFSLVIGGPLGSFFLSFDGIANVHGWQWLFLLEGLPACLLGFAMLKWLPDGPARAEWLADSERDFIAATIHAESAGKTSGVLRTLRDVRVLLLGIAYAGILFAIFGINFWLPLMVQEMGFSNNATGIIVALVYAASVPAMIWWGRSCDQRGERIWHTALATLLAAAGLVLASVVQNEAIRLVALAVAEVGLAAVLAPFYSVPSLFLSGRAMAGGFALVSSMGGLFGGFAGQYAIGLIREGTGGYVAVFVAMAAALTVSTVIVLGLARAIEPKRVPAGVQAKA